MPELEGKEDREDDEGVRAADLREIDRGCDFLFVVRREVEDEVAPEVDDVE
jgi:hypothetical protein